MRIDAHQHFWRYSQAEYGWITDELSAIRRDFLPEDLAPVLTDARFDGCVAVQARSTHEETTWLLELAREHPFVRGVVGWVDLCAPDLAAELAPYAGESKLVGIRHIVQDEPDDRFVLREDFRAGVGGLAAHGLVYDLLLHPRHLAPATELVASLPDQPFVLDHLAKPFAKRGEIEPWGRDIDALARHDNVTCKVSGLVTEADWQAWTPEGVRPYLDRVLEAFGPDRLMFGSDWPVCLLASTHGRWLACVEAWCAGLGEDERAAILGGNAARVYGL